MSASTRIRRRPARAIAALAVSAAGLVTVAVAPSSADPAPSSTDVVGVGSDAVQYIGDFLADGDYNANLGYNAAGNINRLVSFDSVGDANGRAGYLNGTATNVNPTIVLRAGTEPITRPNGAGAGLSALLVDSTHKIDFVRSPALPTAAQENTASTATGVGVLRSVQVATDVLGVATASTTNAPAGLSATELAHIYHGDYLTWGDIPGYTGSDAQKAATIIPYTLPATATTWKNFLADLTASSAGITFSTSGTGISNPNVKPVEQNDPTVITNGSDAPNEILPIFKGRLTLYANGYFHAPNASNPLPIGAAVSPAVKFLTGTPPDAGTNEATTTPFYIIFRESDAESTTPWQPGGVKNWAQELFILKGTSQPFVKSAAAQAEIASSGATYAYNDAGPGAHGA